MLPNDEEENGVINKASRDPTMILIPFNKKIKLYFLIFRCDNDVIQIRETEADL